MGKGFDIRSTDNLSVRAMNLRTPEIMGRVQAQVEEHYRSSLVERIRSNQGTLKVGRTTIHLAKKFGFCYGVERAIDLTYAARRVFQGERIFILGEIIHNPEVNRQMRTLGIQSLLVNSVHPDLNTLRKEDVVIVPAFGIPVMLLRRIRQIGCRIVDTTCGDVMSVWKRVQKNASESITSVIHGKAYHEETQATASYALGKGASHFLIVLNLEETEVICRYIRKGGRKSSFLRSFQGAFSPGFDPDLHLRRVGVANQTTMLKMETEAVQRRIRNAIMDRDGGSEGNFRSFDTICGATQERQDALFSLLHSKQLHLLLVIGGYNSSNTAHLAEIGNTSELPTYFIHNSQCLESAGLIRHFHIALRREIRTMEWLPNTPLQIGITAGASCPNNLIEEVIRRLLDLRGEALQQTEPDPGSDAPKKDQSRHQNHPRPLPSFRKWKESSDGPRFGKAGTSTNAF
ncbi:MAG: 4-hydroxy-3-methylbut-2-enyl diphosphate reductase [Candidatus Xiphinematobacter sp.]|nr:MAG: 4-hydroxy-3-methylbut-2-enyl diphosphate reductase [Candidatus Xiphinematobacter sp.]